MTKEEALEKLAEFKKESEVYMEEAHIHADEVLCQFLTSLGYGDVAQAFDEFPKWYA